MTGADMTFFATLLALCAYFLPSLAAASRRHRNSGAIEALNLLLGWTVIGWIAALIWSQTADVSDAGPKATRVPLLIALFAIIAALVHVATAE